MDCAKGRAVAGLHDDLMVDILSRVPVKDLRWSMCVSKPWLDLITDPLNRKKLPQTLEGFFHGGADGHRTYGHFTSPSGREESVAPVDPSFSFLTAKLPGVEGMVLLDSCNGVLLFGCTREDNFGYIVCNPATEELVTVRASSPSCPPPTPLKGAYSVTVNGGENRCAYTFLMFDPAVSSHFHLVQIWENRTLFDVETVHSYSSETRAWTDRSSKWKRGENGGEWGLWGKAMTKFTRGRALVNGLLHFLVHHVRKHVLIVAVDGEGKTCRIIGWHDKHAWAEATFIGQSQGHLHCISMGYCKLSVWVLQDYDTQEWILKHNVSTSRLFVLLCCPINGFDIVAIHPDYNSVIFVQRSNQKLLSFDIDSKELRALHSLGEDCRLLFTPYVPCFMETLSVATKD